MDISTWEKLGNRFYRKNEVYEMDWVHKDRGTGVDLARYIVAVGQFGGAIAMTRDPRAVLRSQMPSSKIGIDVFSPAGFLETTIPWTEGSRIIALAWNHKEQLVVVADNAMVHLYDAAMESGAREAKLLPDHRGIIVLTNDEQFFMVANFDEPRTRQMADIPHPDPEAPPPATPGLPNITSWVIHLDVEQRNIEVIAAAHRALYVLDTNEARFPPLMQGQQVPYERMSISPSGRLIALFGNSKINVRLTTDLTAEITSFDTMSKVAPRQLEWCGSDSVVAYWDQLGEGTGTLLMVGPGKQYINYTYDKRIVLKTEVDGVRVISSGNHEFIEAVPEVVEKIFQLGVLKYPGAILYGARTAYDDRDAKADEYIRKLKHGDEDGDDNLGVAIDQCILAAGYETNSETQKKLLKAARFGMDFHPDKGNYKKFVEMVQTLRVLWHVRDYKVAVPLTYKQYNIVTLEVLIDRLVARNVFWLNNDRATNRVLVHWASQMVQADASDDTVARTIIDKIEERQGISYAEIAQEANLASLTHCVSTYAAVRVKRELCYRAGKPDLAIRLLEHEPSYSEQAKLLVQMNEEPLALDKATESGDPGIAHYVIQSVQQGSSGAGDFLRFIHTKPGARELFLQFCRQTDKERLKDYYFQHDMFKETGHMLLEEAYTEQNTDACIGVLETAARDYHKARDTSIFMKQATIDQLQLLKAQMALEKALKRPDGFVNMPLGETIFTVIMAGDMRRADQLRKDFKVPDKRWWWIKVKALAESSNWGELDRFSKSKKSPIGYQPFVTECIAKGNRFEAKKYVVKMPADERVPFYCKVQAWEEAVTTAVGLKNEEQLELIQQACGGRRDVMKMIADRTGGGGR